MSNKDWLVISAGVSEHARMTDDPTLSRAERNRLQLRADIIQAAFLEFSERGYHQTAIADIAQRLGIGHGTVYRHFENKRDLLDQVINETSLRLTALLTGENAPTAVDTLADYRAQCHRIVTRLNAFAVENPGVLRLVLLEATSVDAAMTQRLFDLIELMGQLVAVYMANGVQHGYFRDDLDVEATGRAVIGLIMGGMMHFLARPDAPEALTRYSEAAMAMLIDGAARRD